MPDKFELGKFLPFRVTALAEGMSRSLSQRYREPYGISVPEWRILATLNRDNSLNAGELRKKTHMEKPRVSRALNKMEKRGLIIREPDICDSRVSNIRLSQKGEKLYKQIEPIAIEWEQALLSDLTDKEIRCVQSVLDKLVLRLARMERKDEPETR